MKAFKKTLRVIAIVILWIIILLAALFAFTTIATRDDTHVANIAGITPMTVQSDSMAPTFRKGDMIIIKKCDPATLEVGDIVCFHTIIENQYVLNTHRVAEIEDNGASRSYTTKGDNNSVSDKHIITDGDIVGKYTGKVSYLGKVMDFLSSTVGFLIVIVLPLLIFFIYQVYHLIVVGINLKKATALELEEEKAKIRESAGQADEETERLKAEAEKAKAEAEAALEEARRIKAEAEAQLAKAKEDEKTE